MRSRSIDVSLRLLVVMVLFGGVIAVAARRSVAAEGRRPNVLFIAVDDLRPEFGAYGAGHVHSPNLDRIAARGVTFQRAYCQQAVCSPSRSSLLTGCRPDSTKVWDLETHFRVALPDVVTLPQHFKDQGYFVRGLGKLYHGGFDDPPSWSVPWAAAKTGRGAYALPENQAIVRAKVEASQGKKRINGQKVRNNGPPFESADVADNYYADGTIADMAVEAIRENAKRDEPFWLGVGFVKPHLPFVAPKRYWDLYDPASITLASNPFVPKGAPEYAVLPGGELRSYHGVPAGPVPDEMARQLKHGYYAAISYMDAQVGRLLDELEATGQADNTIIVLWGDHGWKLGEHGGWCKHSNVENDTNAPLLIAAPMLPGDGDKRLAGPSGVKTKALAEFVDVYPTLAELCGLPLPGHLEGTSLVPVLRDPSAQVKGAAFSQYPRGVNGKRLMGYSMRTDRYRFTKWVQADDHGQVDAIELYDHQVDPQENTNIAAEAGNAELVATLDRQWQAGWRGAKIEPQGK